jgi:hypothetical protein
LIVCSKCGFENEDSDAFCGSCASFLEWEGQKVVAPVAPPDPEPSSEPPDGPVHGGIIERVKEVIGIGGEPGGSPAAPPAPVAPAAIAEPGTPDQPEPPRKDPGAVSVPVAGATGPVAVAPAGVARLRHEEPVPPPPGAPVPPVSPPPGAPVPPVSPPPGAPVPPVSPPPGAPVPPAAPPPETAGAPVRPASVQRASSASPGPAVTGEGVAGAVVPEAVKPQAPARRPPPRRGPGPAEVINEGDKVCGQCGTGNDPHRHFCRRCGASLVEAELFRLGFWARLRRRLSRKAVHQAGARPKVGRRGVRGLPGMIARAVVALVVIAAAVVAVLSFVGPYHKSLRARESRYYHDVVGVVHPTYNPLYPACPPSTPPGCPSAPAIASSAAPGHPAALAVDGATNTSWQSNGSVTGQWLTVWFAQPADVAKIGFDSGDQDASADFQTEARPDQVQLVFFGPKQDTAPAVPGSPNVIYTKTVTLADIPGFQTFSVAPKGATGVTIYVKSVYPSTGANVAIAEVEFFTRS